MVLENMRSITDVNNLTLDDLRTLCDEIRSEIIDVVGKNGGHLSSALGAVEALVSLCSVYDFSVDKIFFDVGHQSYAFKILNIGKEKFSAVRLEGGASGFCGDDKNSADGFIGGHAGNSLAAASGYAFARDLKGGEENVVVFVGDASMFNGENLEALFVNAEKPKKFLVVFNDNGMSISENRNGAYRFFSKIALKKSYGDTKRFLHKVLGNRLIARCLKRLKSNFKHSVSPATVLDEVGFKYFVVPDGHDVKTLRAALSEIKQREKPCFLHIKTVKGKGYEAAENDPENYHGVSGGMKTSVNDFSACVSWYLTELAEKDDRIVAITAGMKTGTGLSEFAERFPERFVDVGICEEYAVTAAAGMAYNGLKPVVCIYSTFLQRAYDQLVVDVCMQNLPVTFMIDRSGFVGSDGKTHQGLLDFGYLRTIPGLCVLVPKDADELKKMLGYSVSCNRPVAIAYCNGKLKNITDMTDGSGIDEFSAPGKWKLLRRGNKIAIFAVGNRMISLALGTAENFGDSVAVVNARSIKPLDEKTLDDFVGFSVVTLEENSPCGGFGEGVAAYYAPKNKTTPTVIVSSGDAFCEHATVERQLKKSGLSVSDLCETVRKLL